MSSGTFLLWAHRLYTDEWLKMTGALETRMAARVLFSPTCDRSTSMPSLFISRTTFCEQRDKEKKSYVLRMRELENAAASVTSATTASANAPK
ncbi:hypothetical protein EVAR_74109_1, partial [Eumeta japonica]